MNRPLDSLKVLDFSTLLPGPFATMMLADLGADVVRVEAPDRRDWVRMLPPFDGDVSAWHALLEPQLTTKARRTRRAEWRRENRIWL